MQGTTFTLCFYISFLFPIESHLQNFLARCQVYPKELKCTLNNAVRSLYKYKNSEQKESET